ncbi:MAG: hypothetical protein PHN72_05855 [Bacilli bacterium]|nr:hypothetical protein [Bacilli bacterium]
MLATKVDNKTNEKYVIQKLKELQIFGEIDNTISEYSDNLILELLNKKRNLQSEMISNFVVNNAQMRNTNRDKSELKFGTFKCKYEYQRYDIELQKEDFLEFFYECDYKNYQYFFTNSGMSALFCTFAALNQSGYIIKPLGNMYCETERMIDDYLQSSFKDSTKMKKAMFVDTTYWGSIEELLQENELTQFEAFIIDTTNFIGKETLEIIETLEKYKKMIFLVRSHIKLDMLGAEYSKLGSVCLVNPPLIKKSEIEISNKIMKHMEIILAFIGGYAYPESIPLMWDHPNFKEVSVKRILNIKKNTEYLYKKLKKHFKDIDICKPKHNLFLFIRLFQDVDYKVLEKDIHTFADNARNKGLICYADSYGLDHYSVNGYYEGMSATSEVVRISPADLPEEINDKVINEIIEWIGDYLYGVNNYEPREGEGKTYE